MKKLKLAKASKAVHDNPLLKKMRAIAYAPIDSTTNKYKNDTANLEKAELKRLRKQQKRRKENGNHQAS